MNQIARRRSGYRSAPAVLLATLISITLLPASPASASGSSRVYPPNCSTDPYWGYSCSRSAEAWKSNSADVNTIGPVGAYQYMTAYYSPNDTHPLHMTEVNTYAYVKSSGTATPYQRMRMQQTIKALGGNGGQVSVGWGALSVDMTDPVNISSGSVVLSMTRENSGAGFMSRHADLQFRHNINVRKVEQATSATIEYASSNTSYRLLSQVPLTDY